MMRKFIFFTLFFIIFSSTINIFPAKSETFSTVDIVPYPQIVDKINQFRENPFGYIYVHRENFPDINDTVRKSLFDLWRDNKPNYITGGLPILQYDSCLEDIAESNLYSMYDSMTISHISREEIKESCNVTLSGETVIAIAFQNYLTPSDFYKKISSLIIRKAITLSDNETAPITMPFNIAGSALFSGVMKVNGVSYNIYILDIIYGSK